MHKILFSLIFVMFMVIDESFVLVAYSLVLFCIYRPGVCGSQNGT